MPFEQGFKLCSFLLASIAFTGLLLAGTIPAWLGFLTTIIFALTWLRMFEWPLASRFAAGISAPPMIWNGLLIGAFAIFLLDIIAISRELLPAGIHFLVMLLGIKLLTLHQRRDHRQLYAICLMAMLASAALTTDAWYFPIFLLYLFAAVWALLLYNLAGDSPLLLFTSDINRGLRIPSSGLITYSYFWLINGVAIVTLLFTLAIFFVLPRISAGVFPKSRVDGLKTTGFSERVDLGMIGSVKEDPQIVMRVELPDHSEDVKDYLYLRGVAYDHYNGRSWRASRNDRQNLDLIADGTFAVPLGRTRVSDNRSELLRQDILLEVLDTPVLFAVPFAERINGEFNGLTGDGMDGIHLALPPLSRTRYSVISRDRQVLAEEQLAAELHYPHSLAIRYLQLPTLSPSVAELALRVAGEATTPYSKMVAVHRHLLNSYRYSLDVGNTMSPHPIEDFLFKRKTGYCEHFATAMVIMLRELGVPARLVTGFLATEWNNFGHYFTVRQRDAHAWVEVYFPNSGWITMDPTPDSGFIESSSSWNTIQSIGQSFELHWDRLFIRYSARDQLAIFYSLRDSTESAHDLLWHWSASLRETAVKNVGKYSGAFRFAKNLYLGFAAIVVGAGLMLVVFFFRKRLWFRIFSRPSATHNQHQVSELYRIMLDVVERRGIIRRPSTTPLELVREVHKQWAEADSVVAKVTALYCRGRFSESALSHDEIVHVEDQVRALQQLSRATG